MYYISKFCLLCLKEDDGNLQNVENKDSNDISIEEKLDYCVFELISSGHEFPGYLCRECLDVVDLFYNFKQKCFKNNGKIRNFMDSLKQMHFSRISFRDLSVPVHDIIKDQISLPLKRKSVDIKNAMEYKMINLKPETSKSDKNTVMFQCEDCPKQFLLKRQLKRHSTIHSNQLPECSICQKKFARKDTLKRHERLHDNTRYDNKNCVKKFLNKTFPHNETPKIETTIKQTFECGICLKKITHKNNLKRHFRRYHVQTDDEKDNINLSYNIIDNFKQNLSLPNYIDLTDDENDVSSPATSDVQIILTENEIVDLSDSDKVIYKTEKPVQKCKLDEYIGKKINKTENEKVKNIFGEGDNNLQCFVCDKMFTRICKLSTHVNTHFKENTPYRV